MSNEAQCEMPKYKCHKEVWALKIAKITYHAHANTEVTIEEFAKTDEFSGGHIFAENEKFAPIAFDADYYHKHHPECGGYYVVYADGYVSFSPAEAFESGYTLIE